MLRCVHEASLHARNTFVTLTYSPQQLPPDSSLDLRHFQLFCKKLRKRMGPFRFFHVGEYGEASLRPHYHALLFGIDFLHDEVLVSNGGKHNLFASPTLEACWSDTSGTSRGKVVHGSVSAASAAYVAGYCLKKFRPGAAPSAPINLDTGVQRTREYVTMSRRPGIGAGWIDRFHTDVYPDDQVIHDGCKLRPPRYYDSRAGARDPAEFEGVRARRRRWARENREALSSSSTAAKAAEARSKFEMFHPKTEV